MGGELVNSAISAGGALMDAGHFQAQRAVSTLDGTIVSFRKNVGALTDTLSAETGNNESAMPRGEDLAKTGLGGALNLAFNVTHGSQGGSAGLHELHHSFGADTMRLDAAGRRTFDDVNEGRLPAAQRKSGVLKRANAVGRNLARPLEAADFESFERAPAELAGWVDQNRRAHPDVQLLLPATLSPEDLFEHAQQGTALSVKVAGWQKDIEAGGNRGALAMSRVTLATYTVLSLIDYVASGTMTGRGPSDPGKRAQLAGWMPHAVKIGDRYVPMDAFGPLAATLKQVANFSEGLAAMSGKDWERYGKDAYAALTFAIAGNITRRSVLSGVSRLFDTIANPDPARTQLLMQTAAQIFHARRQAKEQSPRSPGAPAPAAGAAPAASDAAGTNAIAVPAPAAAQPPIDPFTSAAADKVKAFRTRIPGLSKGIPAMHDALGREKTDAADLRGPFSGAARISGKEGHEPIDDVLAKNGITLDPPDPEQDFSDVGIAAKGDLRHAPELLRSLSDLVGNGAKLSEIEIDGAVHQLKRPTGLRDLLNQIVSGAAGELSDLFETLSDGPQGGKAGLIHTLYDAALQQAKSALASDPKLAEQLARQGQVDSGAASDGASEEDDAGDEYDDENIFGQDDATLLPEAQMRPLPDDETQPKRQGAAFLDPRPEDASRIETLVELDSNPDGKKFRANARKEANELRPKGKPPKVSVDISKEPPTFEILNPTPEDIGTGDPEEPSYFAYNEAGKRIYRHKKTNAETTDPGNSADFEPKINTRWQNWAMHRLYWRVRDEGYSDAVARAAVLNQIGESRICFSYNSNQEISVGTLQAKFSPEMFRWLFSEGGTMPPSTGTLGDEAAKAGIVTQQNMERMFTDVDLNIDVFMFGLNKLQGELQKGVPKQQNTISIEFAMYKMLASVFLPGDLSRKKKDYGPNYAERDEWWAEVDIYRRERLAAVSHYRRSFALLPNSELPPPTNHRHQKVKIDDEAYNGALSGR